MELRSKIEKYLLYGGISKEEFRQVQPQVAESNHRALNYWTVLVSGFWIYCLLMSLRAADYARCRPAYTVALASCVFCYFCSRYLVPRFPKALYPVMYLFRLLALLGGGIGIALCQWDVRSLTMFAVAIVSPSIFIDSTLSSILVHLTALVLYIVLGRNVIAPDIYSWGLGNFILFSVFGLLIGHAINKERFERYVFAERARKLAEIQTWYAYNDQLTGLKNRRAFAERLTQLQEKLPPVCCAAMIDINGLKQMNDTHGHDAGDELIVGAAKCIRAAFPDSEDVYRIGGDEFCVFLMDSEAAMRDCLRNLERHAVQRRGSCFDSISVASGMASRADSDDLETIVSIADDRMYEAKRLYYMTEGHDRRRRA